MAVTMSVIADTVGVSIATVSRVLSGSTVGVSENTRRTILEAADNLGYRPRRRIGKTVAFVIDKELFNLSSLFYTSVITGIEKEVALRKLLFQFSAVGKGEALLHRLNVKPNELAGVVLVGVYEKEFVDRLRARQIPVVSADSSVPTEDIDAVLVDNVDGIMRAAKYLSGLGHRAIAYISGTVDTVSSLERREGYLRAREAYGLETEASLVEECPECMSGGFDAMSRILQRRSAALPTAVIAYNDMVAIGAMDAAKQRGMRIPEDLSIVGFDDISLAAEVTPSLTTLQVPKELMGKLSAELLFGDAEGAPHVARKTLLPATLVVRASTGAPASQ